jgi:starch synthase
VTSDVGGLRDTVVSWPNPGCTGFKFDRFQPAAFAGAVRAAVDLWNDPQGWDTVRERAMLQDFSWMQSAREYDNLYRSLEG